MLNFNRSEFVPCPYKAGEHITLSFTPEGDSANVLIDVKIIQPFEPFTLAQIMVVQAVTACSFLPHRFVVKLIDPRFAEADTIAGLNKHGWTWECDNAFKAGFQRVRQGDWNNYWRCLGASNDVPHRLQSDSDYNVHLNQERADWMWEMLRWQSLRRTCYHEAETYKILHPLQGVGIPRLYGTCHYTVTDGTPNLDPFIATVPGLVLEYIDGVSMDKLVLGKDMTEDTAERISQGLLTVLRGIRDNLVIHEDFAPRNVIVRPNDPDHPVIIDFGSAKLRTSFDEEMTEEEWIETIAGWREVLRARNQLADLGFHNPSPIPELMEDEEKSEYGYSLANGLIRSLRPEWREKYYDEVKEASLDPDKLKQKGKEWEPPLWKIKPGVDTTRASADYKWGKKRYATR